MKLLRLYPLGAERGGLFQLIYNRRQHQDTHLGTPLLHATLVHTDHTPLTALTRTGTPNVLHPTLTSHSPPGGTTTAAARGSGPGPGRATGAGRPGGSGKAGSGTGGGAGSAGGTTEGKSDGSRTRRQCRSTASASPRRTAWQTAMRTKGAKRGTAHDAQPRRETGSPPPARRPRSETKRIADAPKEPCVLTASTTSRMRGGRTPYSTSAQ